MKPLSFFTVALCTAGLAQLGFAADAAKFSIPDPAAVVEGKEIHADEVQKAIDSLAQRAGKKPSEISDEEKMHAARSVLDSLIMQKLVLSRSSGIKVDDAEVEATFKQFASRMPDPKQFEAQLKANDLTVDKLKDQIRDSIRERRWISQQNFGQLDVSEAEAKALYDSNPTAAKAPEMVRASHILILVPEGASPEVVAEKQKAIDAAAARIAKGEDFAKVAGEVSEDEGSKTKGGDLNFFPKNAMVPEFADVAFALKKDEVSKVVKSKFGFHIIKATDHKDAHVVSFDEARPKITAYLTQRKQQELTGKFLKDLRAKADVKDNLPPEPAAALAPAPAKSDSKPEAKKAE